MTGPLHLFPARVPIGTTSDGKQVRLTPEFLRALEKVFDRIGGASGPSTTTILALINAHIADALDAHDASAISSVPAGDLASTTVQAALDELDAEKAPLSHDHTTADGTGPLTNDEHDGFIEVAVSAAPSAPAAGKMRLYVEDANGVARMRAVHSSGSSLAFFRDAVVRCRNASGGTISKGEIVYITGATGNSPTVAKAKADSASTMPAAGMALSTAADGAFITIQFFGEITGLDTSAFVEGDKLWTSATTAGAVTTTEPMHPNFSQPIGWVTKANAGDGRIHLYVTLTHEGDDSGTNRNEFHVGDTSAGNKDVIFHAAVTGTLRWAPTTANRTITLPDTTGTVALVDGNIGTATGTSLAVTGALTSSGGGIGYTTGAGGTVTQLTDKSTSVTLDELCGTITMHNAALANATTVTFTLTNSFIANTDLVIVQHTSGGTLGAYNFAVAPGAGSAAISVRNVHTGSLSEAVVLRFFVLKAVTS